MHPTVIITIYIINLIGKYQCSRVEISLEDNSKIGSKLKLICSPPIAKSSGKSNGNILWQGFKFGPAELRQTALKAPSHISIPNMRLNSHSLKCILEALKSAKGLGDANKVLRQQREAHSVTTIVPNLKISKEDRSRTNRELAGIPQTEKDNCPPGYRIGKDRCFPCFPGSYTSGQETECFLCPKDFFVDKEGADSCWPCPNGRSTLKEGSYSKDDCIDPTSGANSATRIAGIWIFLIILLLIFLLFSWIAIIYLLVRLCFSKQFQTGKEINIEENGAVPRYIPEDTLNQNQKSKQLLGRIRCSRHGKLSPIRKQIHFDVDIKGSATFTDGNSSSTEDCNASECKHGRNIQEDETEVLNETTGASDSNMSAKVFHLSGDAHHFEDTAQESNTDMDNTENVSEDHHDSVWKENEVQIVLSLDSQQLNIRQEEIENNISGKQNSGQTESQVNRSSSESVRNSGSSVDGSIVSGEVKSSASTVPETELEMSQEDSSIRDLYSKSDKNQNGTHSKLHSLPEENGDYRNTIDPSQEKAESFPPISSQLQRTSALFKNLYTTKPTSCPMHSDSGCHVEVVLIHLNS